MINLDTKTKKYLELAGKILLLVLFLGILAWFFIINPFLIRQEKQRFESAATELDKLSQQIQSKIGVPAELSREASCGRANLKSEKGPLSCNVSSLASYGVSSADDANLMLSKGSSLSPLSLREGPLASGTSFINSTKSLPQIIYQDIGVIQSLDCVTSFEYYPQGSLENKVGSLNIIVDCGGSARAEHYPVDD